MRLRNWMFGTLIALVAATSTLRAGGAEPASPTVVVRLKSIDGLLADAKYVAALVGQEEQAKQLQGLLDAMAGPKGLAGTGIDTKRPIGLYGVVTPGGVDSYGAVLIPVADEKAFIEFIKTVLGQLQADVARGADGVFTVKHPSAPVEIYFTVADRYAYITAMSKDALDAAKRFSPARILAADDAALASVTVHIDQLPDLVKQIALGQIEVQMSAAKDQKTPGETPAQTKLRVETIDFTAQQFKSLLSDAQTLELKVGLDSRADEVSAQFSLSAKPGSPLAKDIADMGNRTTTFGGFRNLALQMGVNLAIPPGLRAPLAAVVDEGFQKELDKEKDPAKKDIARKVFGVLGPLVKAGRFESYVGLHGPDAVGKYTAGAALRVPDGKAIEKLVKELVTQVPPKERELIRLDADSAAGTSIHRIDIGKTLDDDGKRIFGEKAEALLAFPREAIVVTFGANASTALKTMLESKTANPAAPFSLETSIARLAGLDKDRGPVAQKVATAVFGSDPQGKDLFQLSIEGGSAIRVRMTFKGQVIKFGAQLNEKAGGSK